MRKYMCTMYKINFVHWDDKKKIQPFKEEDKAVSEDKNTF